MLSVLGIEDKYVWLAYVLCVASSILCVIYGLITRNRGEEPVAEEDVRWASEEEKVKEEL